MNHASFASMPLAAPLLQALAEKGYTLPSPIQARAIPVLLEGRDLLACAQTGTGKTAAFALPILHGIAQRNRQTRRHEVRSLILTPTRELAVQVADSFRAYGKNLRFRIGVVYGGMSQHPQVRALQNGLDVLVATPGRLLDLMEQGHVDLSGVGCFVLDEGDRMLDMGFIEDIRTIAAQLPAERQTMLFSATMAPEITRLAASLLRTPEEIRIAPQGTTAENIDQRVYFVQRVGKQALLFDLINRRMQEDSGALSLVFSRTKHGASKLADQLNRAGIRADAIHGDKTQAARQKALNRFRDGATPVLVATDVAARGIDVRNIGMVVNYDVPVEPDIYVHRIGRTARAGTSGSAVTFCSEDDLLLFRSVERFLKCTVPVEANHAHHAEAIAARHLSGSRDRHAQGGARKKTGGPAKYRSGPARSVSPYASGPGKKPFQKKPFRRGQFARAWQN